MSNELATLLRHHGLAGRRLSISDMTACPGALELLASIMKRPVGEVSPHVAGKWFSANVEKFPGIAKNRAANQTWYRCAPVVQVTQAVEPEPVVFDPPGTYGPHGTRRSSTPAAVNTELVVMASAPAPMDPELRRQLDVLAILQAAKPKAGWTLPRLQLIERTANIKLSAKHAGRTPIMWPCVQQHEVAPKMFPRIENTDRPWPANGAPIQLRPWRI